MVSRGVDLPPVFGPLINVRDWPLNCSPTLDPQWTRRIAAARQDQAGVASADNRRSGYWETPIVRGPRSAASSSYIIEPGH